MASMNFRKKILVGIFTFTLWMGTGNAIAGIFDNDEENWRRIFTEIKKINARLISLESERLKAIQTVQQDLIRQIEQIKNIIPDIQGTVEQNQSEMAVIINKTNQKLGSLEAFIRDELPNQLNSGLDSIDQKINGQLREQKDINEKFQASLVEQTNKFQSNLVHQFDQLKSNLAADMDKLAKSNDQSFQQFAQANAQTLEKMVEQLNAQNQTIEQTKEILRVDLIPTIVKENEKSRNLVISELSQTKKINAANQQTILAGFAEVNAKSDKLIGVLQQSVKLEEDTRSKIDLLSANLGQTNENIIRTHDDIIKLKDGLVQQLNVVSKSQADLALQVGKQAQEVGLVNKNLIVADGKINKLAESLKGLFSQNAANASAIQGIQQGLNQVQNAHVLTGEKLDKLISSSTQLASHANKMNESLQTMGHTLHTIEGGIANVDLANQKLTKLIDILKAIAAEQGKMSQVMAQQQEIKQSQDQVLKTQLELNKVQVQMGKAQSEMSKAQVAMNQDQNALAKSQAEIRQAQLQMNQSQSELKRLQEEVRNAQAQVLKSQAEIRKIQDQILRGQAEIKKAQSDTVKAQAEARKVLSELSRKANVNISRNDAIRKTLANIAKTPASSKPRN